MSSPGGGAPYRELFLAVSQPMLVERLREYGDVSPASEDEASGSAAAAERALAAVDRAHFLDTPALKALYEAYRDTPLPAKDGLSLLAAPSLHLRMLTALAPPLLAPAGGGARRRRVLALHSGCGYMAIALSAMLAEAQGGDVLAADARPACVAAAEAVAASEPYRRLRAAVRLRFIQSHDVALALRAADEGAADEGAPRAFDAVLVEGATAHVSGQLLERLAPGGRLLAPLLPAETAGGWLAGLLHAQSPQANLTLFKRDARSGAISSAELARVQGLQAADYP
jgi:protein-L-isoaspartate O-methyltransferase